MVILGCCLEDEGGNGGSWSASTNSFQKKKTGQQTRKVLHLIKLPANPRPDMVIAFLLASVHAHHRLRPHG